MLTLNDGRSELWQWDTCRKLTVDAECSQVHFSNKVFGRSVDVDVVDGVAIIPDILLQIDKDLIAWAFVGTAENGYTKISKVFKVNKRNKPADYVFTPPEQTTLEEIKEKIEYLESIQDPDAIKNAVEDYLEQNPVESPVQSVNGKTGKIKLTAEDVGAISQDKLQEATNEALAQAKANGEFDGEPGAPGQDYVLTPTDKAEIAEMAAGLVEIPDSGGNSVLCVTVRKDGSGITTVSHTNNEIQEAYSKGMEIICHYSDMDMSQSLQLVHCMTHQCTFTALSVLGDHRVEWKVIIERNVPAVEMNVVEYVDPETFDEFAGTVDKRFTEFAESAEKAFNRLPEVYQPKGNYVTEETAEQILGEYVRKDELPGSGGNVDLGVTGATVGQTVKISAVDENGVPTAWLPTDFPSGVGGGKWELIAEGTVPEETIRVLIDKDINGNNFELVSWYLFAVLEPCENNGTGLVHTEVNYENVCVNKKANENATRYYQSRGEIIGGYVAICAQSYSESDFNNLWEISNFTPENVNFNGNNAKNISLYYGVDNNIAGANSKYVLYGVRV